ncbi:oligosaccharide flippase family protein [Pontibacter sp. JH31]|uniref:Oligosaccharide flippase family protein n=1 Tax=Pontibacter aquaedesilientis TaxID=2766980 RepID=A0ABR7XJ78_9BACT|nr:oligosaccharide flippase family protein [Pontibacter aquaedesilientis]MBD1398331.1 oligosaccharide flippase family protein [Pontibacter aquaedesilientis]
MLRKLLSHAAIYGLAAQVPRLAGVLALPLITQYLTPTDYGVAGVVTAYFAAFVFLHSLGFSIVLGNSFVKYPARYQWIWRQLYGFLTGWSVFFGLLVMGVFYFVVPAEAHHDRLAIAVLNALPILLFSTTDLVSGMYCQLAQRPLPIALRSFIVGTAHVLLNIYFIAYLHLGYMGWFYSAFISALIGFIFSFYIVFEQKLWPILRYKRQRILHTLRVSLPVVPHHFANFMLDTSDRLVLDTVGVPIRRIGLYNVASSFGIYFMSASFAVVQAATPVYMKLLAQEKSPEAALQMRSITYSLQLLFFAATFLGSLWMKEVFSLLIRNEELQQAYPLAIIILMGYNFRPMYLAVGNLLTYHEHTNKLWRISGVAGIGNIVLNFILVPLYGFEMAAYTTFAALMYMGYSGYFLKAYKELAQLPYYPMAWLLATMMLLLLAYQLREVHMLVKAGITFLTLLAGIALYMQYRTKAKWQV